MKDEKRGLRFGKIVVMVVTFAVLLVVFTCLVLHYNNERNAEKTNEVLLNQLFDVMVKNKADEEALLESLKEEYMIRARTVAYMLDHHPEAEYDVEEQKKIAALMSIDEIHLFDETGTIYSGTCPQYYGYSFDSGEQMSYFKPMLSDRSLSMCQDVEPNTAEGKEMMYAITWNKDGTRMIQVGIAPVRMLAELEDNKLSNVVKGIPVYENVDLFVADASTEEILGTTAETDTFELKNLGIRSEELKKNTVYHVRSAVNGKNSICSVMKFDEFIIGVVQDISARNRESLIPVLMIVLCLIIACTALLMVIHNLLNMRRDKMEQLMILTSMSGIYFSMHLIDLENNSYREYAAPDTVREAARRAGSTHADVCMQAVINDSITEPYLQQSLQFSDLTTLAERMKDRKVISMDLIGKHVGWVRMSFISISRDPQQRVNKVICATQNIDEEKRKEEALIMESNTDQLTGCSNRRAYENDLLHSAQEPLKENFVLVSVDVNGLKAVNDTLGHGAGDELLLGAAMCMQRCFGPYGKVYRLGGDEFAAVIYTTEEELTAVRQNFEEALQEWSGETVQSLSVSCGYVSRREFPELDLRGMEKAADERMYQEKARYYGQKDRDRRNPGFQ
ncbi:MAG: GGDEF domain-containing protein [Anaerovoracaceae bacterium]